MRTWPIYLGFQPPEGAKLVAGSGGTLVIGPALGELDTIRKSYAGPVVVATLPDVDMHDMPYMSGSFDRVIASNVLEHAFAPYCALMEIRRVLKPGGEAHLAMPSFDGPESGVGPYHLHCLDRPVWQELMRKCGLELEQYAFETGVFMPTSGYHVFHVRAGTPPTPHDTVLQKLITFHAEHDTQ